MKIKTVGIILKKGSTHPPVIAGELIRWFQARGIAAAIDHIAPGLDLLVILGGDGTLLHVADQASEFDIPVVGVNLGGLGFLTEIHAGELYKALEIILDGQVRIKDRMMLKARLYGPGRSTEWRCALNEVTIGKAHVDRLIRLTTWADEEYITTYRADGLIFSTPTGSTAYNLSAGGPIVHPECNAILGTPMCPFMLESRSVLLPSRARLVTRMVGPANDVQVIIDGQPAWPMDPDDRLEVAASDRPLRIIGSPFKNYFEILRSKLNWGGGKTDHSSSS